MNTEETSQSQDANFKWRHPDEVMKLHRFKKKKKALQARLNLSTSSSQLSNNPSLNFQNILEATKRKNPFITNSDSKKSKADVIVDVEGSSDSTLFKLLHCSSTTVNKENRISFKNILKQDSDVTPIRVLGGEKWLPIDWTLKSKARFVSSKPLQWSHKLKISEEASGLTSFARCLDTSSTTTLDISPNARFHQCCLFWQQPCLPWINLFPRTSRKAASSTPSVAVNPVIKQSLQEAWTDGLKSLFQLIRTRQCPYFYVCADTCTILVRAPGICGFSEMHALITPTTRGFRHLMRQEDIEFKLPLKKSRNSDQGCDTLDSMNNIPGEGFDSAIEGGIDDDEEAMEDEWLKDMGISADDIRKINYTQAKIDHKSECEVDNGEQSLTLIEGLEVQGFYNFLLNCKSITPSTGPLAGIPPTLLAPVAFRFASLNSLKVRENKIRQDNEDFYSVELTGPILPHTIHNLYNINPVDNSLSTTFINVNSTAPFSKIKYSDDCDSVNTDNEHEVMRGSGSVVFKKENLKDCGFSAKVLEQFCTENPDHVLNYDCLKYCADSKTYSWS